MKKYKLTTQDLTTYNNFQWVIGKKEQTDGKGNLCSNGWLHYYYHPLLAVLLNPIHANIKNPKLFEIETDGNHLDDRGLKGGCTNMTLIKEIKLPEITLIQKIAFGILCATEVYKEDSFLLWANNWLNNISRSSDAAYAAAYAADTYAANAAAAAAANAAVYAYANAYAYAATAAVYVNINLIKIAKKAMKYK